MSVEEFLQISYNDAMGKASGKNSISSSISGKDKTMLDTIISFSEQAKGVVTVLFTSVVYKSLNPNQDVRRHQTSITNGYSGRTFDSQHITPFLKRCKFPSMAESGWLTRSLEQKAPYNLDYKGAINPPQLKLAFLGILDRVESNHLLPKDVVDYILQGLIIQRERNVIDLAIPQNLSINNIMILLESHFHAHYKAFGASRLPVLALYAVYQCLTKELKRFSDKTLLQIESHTSADARSGRMGDIDVVNSDNTPFEAVEVKFDIPISHEIVVIAKDKIQTSKISRYYILSTKEIKEEDKEQIETEIRQIKNIHGCQLVVNGVMQSLKYYLRLVDNLSDFVGYYTTLLANDKTIKYEHKTKWNELVANLQF